MAYNITMVDKSGAYRTMQIAPDRSPLVKRSAIATNHQGAIEWHNHARATATIEREQFLTFRLQDPQMSTPKLADAFLQPPLYTHHYASGFGTLYTSLYRPRSGRVSFYWPGNHWDFSLDHFTPGEMTINFS